MLDASNCRMCPRECGVDRTRGESGVCGAGEAAVVSRIALHPYEEPVICGERGAGTIFFSGCSLGCVYCQNKEISRGESRGEEYSAQGLAEAMLSLEREGASCIDLVTPTHYAHVIVPALKIARRTLSVPVVYNTSGYERVETLKELEGLVDVYMPDFKYASSELAKKYSSAPDYPAVAAEALREMYRQVGACEYGEDGMLKRGIIVRHLVLPGARKDSIEVLKTVAGAVPAGDVLLSLMSQYTPDFALDTPYGELHRRITKFEYDSVLRVAEELGFDGFMQYPSSASSKYTPDFKGGTR